MSDRVSGGIGDADGATLVSVATSSPPWRVGGLDGLSDGQAGVGSPLLGGAALHWDNIPAIGGKIVKLQTLNAGRYRQ